VFIRQSSSRRTRIHTEAEFLEELRSPAPIIIEEDFDWVAKDIVLVQASSRHQAYITMKAKVHPKSVTIAIRMHRVHIGQPLERSARFAVPIPAHIRNIRTTLLRTGHPRPRPKEKYAQ
jgi:hypothetical protein